MAATLFSPEEFRQTTPLDALKNAITTYGMRREYDSRQPSGSVSFFTPEVEGSLRPQLETIFVNTRPMVPTATAPVSASPVMMQAPRLTAAEILNRARAAVLARRREQEQQGVVPYTPANPAILDDTLRNRLRGANIPAPAFYSAAGELNAPVLVQQRGGDSGGATTTYGSGERVVTGRYGSGSATKPANKAPMTITENGKTIPAAKWFQEAANRQGQRIVVGGYDRGSIFEPKTKKEA